MNVYIENGPALQRNYPANFLKPNTRYTFDIESEFPEVAGRRFGVRLESFGTMTTAPMPIVVERAMYSDANGVFWGAGSNVVGSR